MNWLKKFFTNLWSVVKPEAETAIEQFEAKVTPDVYKLAEDAIVTVESLGLKDTAARDAAIEQLKTDAEKTGADIVAFSKSELNALIELAYLAVKPTLPAASTANTTGAGLDNAETEGKTAVE